MSENYFLLLTFFILLGTVFALLGALAALLHNHQAHPVVKLLDRLFRRLGQ